MFVRYLALNNGNMPLVVVKSKLLEVSPWSEIKTGSPDKKSVSRIVYAKKLAMRYRDVGIAKSNPLFPHFPDGRRAVDDKAAKE